MKNIEISSDVYDNLDQLAKGFDDTPNTVIERLIKQNFQSHYRVLMGYLTSVIEWVNRVFSRNQKN